MDLRLNIVEVIVKKFILIKLIFAIPKLKLLIEIKDNHIWHKEQVQSGKWEEKVNGVEKFLQNNSYIW